MYRIRCVLYKEATGPVLRMVVLVLHNLGCRVVFVLGSKKAEEARTYRTVPYVFYRGPYRYHRLVSARVFTLRYR